MFVPAPAWISTRTHTHTLSYFARQDFVFSFRSFLFSSSACVRLKGCLKDEKNVTYSPPRDRQGAPVTDKDEGATQKSLQGEESNENIHKQKMMKK